MYSYPRYVQGRVFHTWKTREILPYFSGDARKDICLIYVIVDLSTGFQNTAGQIHKHASGTSREPTWMSSFFLLFENSPVSQLDMSWPCYKNGSATWLSSPLTAQHVYAIYINLHDRLVRRLRYKMEGGEEGRGSRLHTISQWGCDDQGLWFHTTQLW